MATSSTRRTRTAHARRLTEPTPGKPRRRAQGAQPHAAADQTDRKIIDLLATDGRASNRALALATGLTEAAVASRLARLRELRRLHVTAQFDQRLLGLTHEMIMEIRVRGRTPRSVAQDIATLPSVQAVSLILGTHDISANTLSATPEERDRLLVALRGVDGVDAVQPVPVIGWQKRVAARGALAESPRATIPLDHAQIDLDDLDRQLIEHLIEDGRQSNRAIARNVGVAESTIRTRLRRLEEAGFLRIVGVADRTALGLTGDVVSVAIDVDGDPGPLTAQLIKWPETMACCSTLTRYPVRALMVTQDASQLAELLSDRLRALPGVWRVETQMNIERIMHNYLVTQFV